jgi:hypothetical protein
VSGFRMNFRRSEGQGEVFEFVVSARDRFRKLTEYRFCGDTHYNVTASDISLLIPDT